MIYFCGIPLSDERAYYSQDNMWLRFRAANDQGRMHKSGLK